MHSSAKRVYVLGKTTQSNGHHCRLTTVPDFRSMAPHTSNKKPLVLNIPQTHIGSIKTRCHRLFSIQSKLPKLPVPALQQTLSKYLQTVKPVVTDEEYEHTKDLVKMFGAPGGIGETLQILLEKRAKSVPNWLADWWLHGAYLGIRLPVVVHYNPGMVLPRQQIYSVEQQLQFSARIIGGVLDFKSKIDNNELEVEKSSGDPLDMGQYSTILSTCRVPGVKEDSITCYSSEPIKYISVMCNGHIWIMDVFDDNYNILSESDWFSALQQIHVTSMQAPPDVPIGIFTSENRNEWGKIYKRLIKDTNNASLFKKIHSSIFTLCLDKPCSEFDAIDSRSRSAHQMLHGCGSRFNSNNRWFDKTVQIIVDETGNCGCCYEHSPAEGPPIASLMDHILTYTGKRQNEMANIKFTSNKVKVEQCKFNVPSGDIKTLAETAQKRLDVLIEDVDLCCFSYSDYGKQFVKSCKMSPDSYLQVAFQLAFYKMYGDVPATYESGSTRRFQMGRTDNIRSQSMSGKRFCELMLTSSTTDEEKKKALIEAVHVHKAYAIETINGQGIDRHLLGLKMIAIENGLNVPEIHMDTSFLTTMHHRLSTSQVVSQHCNQLCYSPSVEDGYGLCYNPMKDEVLIMVSAWKRYKGTDSKQFSASVIQALNDMKLVLNNGHRNTSKL